MFELGVEIGFFGKNATRNYELNLYYTDGIFEYRIARRSTSRNKDI